MARAKAAVQAHRHRAPSITGRLPEDEKREMKAECARRGIDVEEWVAHACRMAFKRKDYPTKRGD